MKHVSLFAAFLILCFSCSESAESTENKEQVDEMTAQVKAGDPDTLAYVTGKFIPEEDERFVVIDTQYADRPGMLLRVETYDAFRQMDSAARAEGIELVIRSATRNFDYQKGIGYRKWTGERAVENGERLNETTPDPYERAAKILRYSSMPSTSRHHWGTDIDLNSFDNEWFEEGEGKRLYDWLVTHAPSYGFCQVYTDKGTHRPFGYELERWHWSYLPLAQPLTRWAEKHLNNDSIEGFMGAEVADSLQVIERYVLGIDPSCQ
jgi:LAS superfamily LD-carboxypeptidase LdcB